MQNLYVYYVVLSHGIILNNLSEDSLFSSLEKLILNPQYRKKICKLSFKNFSKNLNKAIHQIDNIRDQIFKPNNKIGDNGAKYVGKGFSKLILLIYLELWLCLWN